MNRKYGKVDASGIVTYAPSIVAHDGRSYLNPSAEDYARADDGPWLPVLDVPPSDPAPEGKHWTRTGFFEPSPDGSSIRVKYVLADDPTPTVEDYDKAMEEHLFRERCERGYTTREPDMYTDSEVPRWNADARDWKKHRDAVMLYALAIMNDVAAGGEPPTLEEFKAGLPNVEWTYNDYEAVVDEDSEGSEGSTEG